MLHTGVQVYTVEDSQKWFTDKKLDLNDIKDTTGLRENTGVVVKFEGGNKKEFGIVKNGFIHKISDYPEAFGIKPKNAEQVLAMNMLLDDSIKLKVITGKEGTGKNFITAACVLEMLLHKQTYERIILTRTTDEVGKTLGLFPGSAEEKFANHTASFIYTFKALMGSNSTYVDMMMEKGQIEYIPVQLMRGISFPPGTLIWADEIAGLSPYELRMLGTRLGEDCCLILTGSFEQIDRRIPKDQTGLWKLVNDDRIIDSHLTASIELIKNERSELSKLISDVL